jgi:hypothetical protein
VAWERNIGVRAMRRSWVQLAPPTKITTENWPFQKEKKMLQLKAKNYLDVHTG